MSDYNLDYLTSEINNGNYQTTKGMAQRYLCDNVSAKLLVTWIDSIHISDLLE